jgi:putative transposase
MNLSRSSFYHKLKDKGQVEMQREADLRGRIEAICSEYPRYGYPRVTEQLKREGLRLNHKEVLRVMRESDLLCWIRRRRVKTTDSKHRFRRHPNLINRMATARLNQV